MFSAISYQIDGVKGKYFRHQCQKIISQFDINPNHNHEL